ncbi:MAG: pyridoxal phosphate-dependent aminotransferase [Clostridium sp.]|nr:pyridoxal phosphate-dependent aminotransferase [Clostridium sp.]
MIFSKEAENISQSATLAITAKVGEMKKNGIDVIGFGVGEPDFNTPKNIIDAAKKAMDEGHTKYTPASGIMELKKALVDKFNRDNNLKYSTDQIIISNGGKQCLSGLFQSILNDGDEVVVPSPYWVTYPELIKLYGGKPVIIQTKEEDGFKLTADKLNKAVSSKTKAIVINSPNNPTGVVYSKDDLKAIAAFAKENDLIIISDEMYEKLIYGESKHVSIASLNEDAFKRTVVIGGMSKTYAMTGWRIGFAASNNTHIIKLMSNVQSHTTANPNSIAQYASVEALNGDQTSVLKMSEQFKKRRDYAVEKINSISGISCLKPEGAFYVMINVKGLIGKSVNGKSISSSMDFCKVLLDEVKVAVVPGEAFGAEGFVRLSYATSMENIEEGLDRIEEFVNEI